MVQTDSPEYEAGVSEQFSDIHVTNFESLFMMSKSFRRLTSDNVDLSIVVGRYLTISGRLELGIRALLR